MNGLISASVALSCPHSYDVCVPPQAAAQKDSAGLLPLQVALQKGAVSGVVEALAVAYPEAVAAPCDFTMLPGEVYKAIGLVEEGHRVLLAPGIKEAACLRAGVLATVVEVNHYDETSTTLASS